MRRDEEDNDSNGNDDRIGRQRHKWDQQFWKKPGGERLLSNLDPHYFSEKDVDSDSSASYRGFAGQKSEDEKITASELGESKEISMTRLDKSGDASKLMPDKIQEEAEAKEADQKDEKPIKSIQKPADPVFSRSKAKKQDQLKNKK